METKQITYQELQKEGLEPLEKRKGNQAVFDIVMSLRAGTRTGSASAKTRAMVRGSNKKPWRQKGTGRARAGDKKSNIWRGGGVAHGPVPRSYDLKVNKKVRRLALYRALCERIEEGSLFYSENFEVSDGKTKSFVTKLKSFTEDVAKSKILILSEGSDELTVRSSRNVCNALMFSPKRVNVEQLLYFDKIILIGDALKDLVGRINKKKTS